MVFYMNYKKISQFILGGVLGLILIFLAVFGALNLRANNNKNSSATETGNTLNGANLGTVLNTLKQFISPNTTEQGSVDYNLASGQQLLGVSSENATAVTTLQDYTNAEQALLQSNVLNRKLLDECLAKAENEWVKLQTHYSAVLNDCVNLNLGLNGEKLFSATECNAQIAPYKDRDKQKTQADKQDCFKRYSERQ